MTYSLLSGPTGLAVSPSGAIAWANTEGYWPATNTVTLRVFDNGTPSLSSTGSFQVIVNHRPLPASPTVARIEPMALKVAITDFLGTDPDGDTITLQSIASASAQGVPVTQDGSYVYYRPSGPLPGSDSLNYQIRDARGTINSGAVARNVIADTNTTPSLSVESQGSGRDLARFSGIRGYNDTIEAHPQPGSSQLANPWHPDGR